MIRHFFLIVACCLCSGCSDIRFFAWGQPAVPAEKVAVLNGRTPDQVSKLLGYPVSRRAEGNNELWCYHQGQCSTLVFFDDTGHSVFAENRGQCQK